MFRCYSYTIIRERINLCLPKLHFVKILTTVTSVSTNQFAPWWWCNCKSETCRVCFNVNFSIFFNTTHWCISWWMNKTLIISRCCTVWMWKLYEGYLFGGKGGRCLGLTTLPPSCADCPEILGSSTSWSPQDLYRDIFTRQYHSSTVPHSSPSWNSLCV